jgi:hypothetical protein
MLHFNLLENLLTPVPGDYLAQVWNVRSYGKSEIAERMLKRGSLLTRADILAVLEVYENEIAEIIRDGGAVVTPTVNYFPSISGVFNGAADTFDPLRHKVKINLNAGVLLPTTLVQGTYRLEVRTTFLNNSGKESKNLKIGHFVKELTV